MDLHTVNVRVKGLFQNGEPFCGKLRLKLSTSAVCVDNTIVLPKAWQEHNFPKSGDLTVQLVPNALLCEGSHYVFELVCNKNTGAYIYDRYGKLTTVERGVIVVPDHDCNFTEIVTLEPTQPEPLEAAKAYASEAKEVLRETKEVVAGVAGSADAEIKRIEEESVTIRDNALKAISEEGERVKGIVDNNIETSTNAAKRAENARDTVVEYVDVTFPAKVSRVDANLNNKVTEIDTYLDRKANGIYTAIDAEMVAADAHLEDAQKQIISNIEGKATSVNTALDTKITSATTAIDGKVTEANDAKTDAVKARGEAEGFKGQAEGFAKSASESAESASKSATASATSASQAKTTADSLSAGLATLNGVDGRIATLETTVQPTMAGGLLDVQVGHNAMVRVCTFNVARAKEFTSKVTGAPQSAIIPATGMSVAGFGKFWAISSYAGSINDSKYTNYTAHICDSTLNYLFSIYAKSSLGSHAGFDSQSSYNNGNGWATDKNNSKIFLVRASNSVDTSKPFPVYIQSWTAVDIKDESGNIITPKGTKLAESMIEFPYGMSNAGGMIRATFLNKANKLCVGDALIDPDTLQKVGELVDDTIDAGNESVAVSRFTATHAYIRRSGEGANYNGAIIMPVLYGSAIKPVYIDDLTDPTKPTLRNFVDSSGSVVTTPFTWFACDNFGSWGNQLSYFIRTVDGVMARRQITVPNSTTEVGKLVIGTETKTNIKMANVVSFIESQGYYSGSSNATPPLGYICYGGAIVAYARHDNADEVFAIDTMVNQGLLKLDNYKPPHSRQTDYGYIIPQSCSRRRQTKLSVILNRIEA